MNKKLSIQIYSIMDQLTTEETISASFNKLAEFGYTGIQTAGNFDIGVEKFSQLAKNAGLEIIGTHVKMKLLQNTEEAVRVHKILGTTNAGIGAMPALFDGTLSKESIYKFIDEANEVCDMLSRYGLKFTYHHHAMEFAKVGNDTIMDLLIRGINPDNSSFVMDTYWMQAGGVSITEWLMKLAGRVDILHLKDMAISFGENCACMTELGAGNINFKNVISAAEESGVRFYCYEQDSNHRFDSLTSAKDSADYFFKITS